MKKTARARENPSLHCKEGLMEVSMATPRSFAVSTIATGVPSSEVRGVVGGWPMGRWQHLLELSGRSHVTDQSHADRRLSSVLLHLERGRTILTSSAKSGWMNELMINESTHISQLRNDQFRCDFRQFVGQPYRVHKVKGCFNSDDINPKRNAQFQKCPTFHHSLPIC